MDFDFLDDNTGLAEDALYAAGSELSVFGDYDENPNTGTAWVCYLLIALYVICNMLLLPYLGAMFPDTVLLAKAAATASPEATEMYHFSKDVMVQYAFYVPSGQPAMAWHNMETAFLSLLVLPSIFQIFINPFIIWVFGDNVEYALGHGRFTVFYILTGLLSLVLTILLVGAALTPLCAALGGVSAVMGGYLRLFPHVRINQYRRLSSFSLLRTRVGQTGIKTSMFWLFAGNVVFTWPFTNVEAFGAAMLLPLSGFVLGYWLIPFFRNGDIVLTDPADDMPAKPLVSQRHKNFSTYTTSTDPTDKRQATNPLDPDGDGVIEYPQK